MPALYNTENQDFANGITKVILLHPKRITFRTQKDNFRNAKQ